MKFPGGASFRRLEELVDWAKDRYQRVGKRVERMDVAGTAEGDIVFCQGTLAGVWPDGTPFEGIRFADWFLIRNGRIVRQDVWNDLAEARRSSRLRPRAAPEGARPSPPPRSTASGSPPMALAR